MHIMKIRKDFVTNSSSCSFVIDLRSITNTDEKERIKSMIISRYSQVTTDQLQHLIDTDNIEDVYNLVDYDGGDIFHCWIKRDESMYDDDFDESIFFNYRNYDIKPKFEYHY